LAGVGPGRWAAPPRRHRYNRPTSLNQSVARPVGVSGRGGEGWVPCPWDPRLEMRPSRDPHKPRAMPWWKLQKMAERGEVGPILHDWTGDRLPDGAEPGAHAMTSPRAIPGLRWRRDLALRHTARGARGAGQECPMSRSMPPLNKPVCRRLDIDPGSGLENARRERVDPRRRAIQAPAPPGLGGDAMGRSCHGAAEAFRGGGAHSRTGCG